jgi:hypothetical protein
MNSAMQEFAKRIGDRERELSLSGAEIARELA